MSLLTQIGEHPGDMSDLVIRGAFPFGSMHPRPNAHSPAMYRDPMQSYLRGYFEANPEAKVYAKKTVDMFAHFFSRRYWRRRWILQELSLSRRHCWYWGRWSIEVSGFRQHWLVELWQTVLRIEDGFVEFDNPRFPEEYRNSRELEGILNGLFDLLEFESIKPRDWIWCLTRFQETECLDPRDWIYALASIATPKIQVDYSLTPVGVFVQFAKTMIELGKWSAIIGRAGSGDSLSRRHPEVQSLPSWVPIPKDDFQDAELDDIDNGSAALISMSMSVEGSTLICDVRCLGVMHRMHDEPALGREFELLWTKLFWQICESQGHGETHCIYRPSPLELKDSAYFHDSVRTGDVLCSCLEMLDFKDTWMVLRPAGHDLNTFTLIWVVRPWYILSGGEPSGRSSENVWEQETKDEDPGDTYVLRESALHHHTHEAFLRCPKITVRIV